jgi:hypothetical protein
MVWLVLFIWLVWLVWFNQINKTNQLNETDQHRREGSEPGPTGNGLDVPTRLDQWGRQIPG